MKQSIFATMLFCFLLIVTCAQPEVEVSANFDHGSIGELEQVEPGYFRGTTKHWMKRDSIGDQYYWFYFRADNVQNRTVTFELNNLSGIYRGNPHIVYTDYTRPVFSYDMENWRRITDTEYDSSAQSFAFTHAFTEEPVWIAYAHPYPYSRYTSLISRIKDSDHATVEQIAESPEGRSIHLATITNREIPVDDKRTVLVIALQHAGEDAGGYLAEGMMEYLLSDDPVATKARRNFVYHIVPMMNPDGIYQGTSRYNSNMADLNSIWMDESLTQPEVAGVKEWVHQWQEKGNRLSLFIDVHNHTQQNRRNVFIFQNPELENFVASMQEFWPVEGARSSFGGSSRTWFYEQNIPSGTLELTQSRVGDGDYLTIDDYHQYGRGVVKAVRNYFGIN